MKFIVTRESVDSEDLDTEEGKPCEITRRSREIYVGFDGQESEEEVWVVDIESLSELLQFVKKYGGNDSPCEGIVLTQSPYKGIPFQIDIYDDWRE